MDILDQLSANETPTNLDELVVTSPVKDRPPSNALKSRAATTALLTSSPEKTVERYQAMVSEGERGSDTMYRQALHDLDTANENLDLKGVMSVLSDPNVSYETKQSVVQGMKDNKSLLDDRNTLLTKALSAESKGEKPENEAARLTVADAFRDMNQARDEIQGLVNSHAASLDDASATTFAEMLAAWFAPFGNSAYTYNLAKNIAEKEGRKLSAWESVKAFVLPGTTQLGIREAIEKLPPQQRLEKTKELIDILKTNSGLIMNRNQFVEFDKAVNIWQQGGYSDTQAFLDNISVLLDVIGIGGVVRRGFTAAKKTEATPLPTPQQTPAVGPSSTLPEDDFVSPFAARREKRQQKAIDQINFDPSKPTPDTPPTGPIPGILSERTPGVSFLEGGSGVKPPAPPEPPKKQVAALFRDAPSPPPPREGVSVLEGGTGTKAPTTQEPPKRQKAALFRAVETNGTVRTENPASPAKVIQQANPEQARKLHEAVVNSPTDAAAEGLYGTSRQDAIASDVLPQISPDGAVVSRVLGISRNLQRELDIDQELLDIVNSAGGVQFSEGERGVALRNIKNDFENVSGLTVHTPMSSFNLDGNRIRISAVYGNSEGAWLRPEDAMAQTQLALRAYGIREDEVLLLKKVGLDHVPVNWMDEVGEEGNYFVRVDTFHEVDPTDIVDRLLKKSELESTDVKRNFLDRFAPWTGFIKDPARWVADAASMLHPLYTSAASVADDLTSRFDRFLLDLASKYSDKWNKLPKADKDQVTSYILQANFQRIPFNPANLLLNGFSREQVEALKSWRKFWDAHYYLENFDIVRTLNHNGYELFENANTTLVARPISKNKTLGADLNVQGTRVVGGTSLYNPATDAITVLTKQEIDDLYNSGGTLAKLRRPTDFNGTVAEYMIVRNTPTEYLRKIRESDKLLNYIDGYFQLQYKAPRFVDEVITHPDGSTYTKAVAVAGDTKEAELFAAGLRRQGKTVSVRGDDRGMPRDGDDWWDVNAAHGRIAQRHRGQLLEDGSGLNHLGDNSYIVNPVESAIRAAKNIASRTVTRPIIETAKARFMKQYDKYIQKSDGIGGKSYPQSLEDIGAKGEFTSSELADARTTWMYIRYLENGYLNGVDILYRGFFNMLADGLGKFGVSFAERGARAAGDMRPLAGAKGIVFQAYMALNPLRQLIVQTHQLVRTAAYNPKGLWSGRTASLIGALGAKKMGMNVSGIKGADDFVSWMDGNGLLDSIDKQNLVRGTLKNAAESTSTVGKVLRTVRDAPRKIGFDTAEGINLAGHAAAVFERYQRKGMNVKDKFVRDQMTAEARALSYEMNFAGDMPYNQNSAAMFLQFMQVPHKAFLQIINRKLPRDVRARMFVGDLILWGPPTLTFVTLFGGDILPDDENAREWLTWGAEGILLDKGFKAVFGRESGIDWSSLAPYDMTGWADFAMAMWEGGFDKLIQNSPAGQLLFREGGRFKSVAESLSRYYSGFLDEHTQTPETLMSVLHEIAKISSGYNNAQLAYSEWMRARLATQAINRLDSMGAVVDKEIYTPEIIMKLFGFNTANTRDLYYVGQKVRKESKEYEQEVMKVYKSISRYYAENLGIENTDPRFTTAITGMLLNTFGDDPRAMEIVARMRRSDFQGKEEQLMRQILRASGVPEGDKFNDRIRQAPFDEDTKKKLLEHTKAIREAQETLDALEKQAEE